MQQVTERSGNTHAPAGALVSSAAKSLGCYAVARLAAARFGPRAFLPAFCAATAGVAPGSRQWRWDEFTRTSLAFTPYVVVASVLSAHPGVARAAMPLQFLSVGSSGALACALNAGSTREEKAATSAPARIAAAGTMMAAVDPVLKAVQGRLARRAALPRIAGVHAATALSVAGVLCATDPLLVSVQEKAQAARRAWASSEAKLTTPAAAPRGTQPTLQPAWIPLL